MPAVSSPRICCSSTSGAQNTSGRATCCRSTSTACATKSKLIPRILATFLRRSGSVTCLLLTLKCTWQIKRGACRVSPLPPFPLTTDVEYTAFIGAMPGGWYVINGKSFPDTQPIQKDTLQVALGETYDLTFTQVCRPI